MALSHPSVPQGSHPLPLKVYQGVHLGSIGKCSRMSSYEYPCLFVTSVSKPNQSIIDMSQHLQHHPPSPCSETISYRAFTYRQGVPSIYPWPSATWQKVDWEVSKQTEECSQWQSVKLLMLFISSRASNTWPICLPLSLRFPTLEHCSTGGESLMPEEFKQWKERTGIFIHEIYGQSEMVGEQATSAPFGWAQLQSTANGLLMTQYVLGASVCIAPA